VSRGIDTNTKDDLNMDVLSDDFNTSDSEDKLTNKKKGRSPLKKQKQEKFRLNTEQQSESDEELFKTNPILNVKTKTFHWLMHNLCAPNKDIEALPLNFPDTAFFGKDGQCEEIISTDPTTNFLVAVTSESKLAKASIRKNFPNVVRDRRRRIRTPRKGEESPDRNKNVPGAIF